MSDNKNYYYMRLHENFYEREDIKILQKMRDGYLYTDILMKLNLKSLKCEGRLMFKENIPYDAEMIATITDHKIETVENALKIFEKFNWIEILSNGAIYILDIQNHIGKTSSEGDRKRKYRNKIENEKNFIRNIDEKVTDIEYFEIESKEVSNFENQVSKEITKEVSNKITKEMNDSENQISDELSKEINCSENEDLAEVSKDLNCELKDTIYEMGQKWDICPPEKEIEKEIETETETEIKKETKIETEIKIKKEIETEKEIEKNIKTEIDIEKNIKSKENDNLEKDEFAVGSVLKHFERCGFIISSRLIDFIKADITVYGQKYLMSAANICVRRGKLNNYGYLTGIIQNWRTNGYKQEGSSYIVKNKSFGYAEKGYYEVRSDKEINHAAYSPMRSILDE